MLYTSCPSKKDPHFDITKIALIKSPFKFYRRFINKLLLVQVIGMEYVEILGHYYIYAFLRYNTLRWFGQRLKKKYMLKLFGKRTILSAIDGII